MASDFAPDQPAFAPDHPEFYLGDPHASFARLRAEDPLAWYEAGGFWCVTKHSDIQQVSRNPRQFSSRRGTQIFEIPIQRAGGSLPASGAESIIRMDPPEHNRHRKLVIQAFTPRVVAELEPRIREIARKSIQDLPRGETVNYVERVCIPMPMFVIAELLGIPSSDYEAFTRWSDAMVEAGSGGVSETTIATLGELFGYFNEMLAVRRKAPRDDLISLLLAAEIEGEKLTEPALVMFLMTLLVAGNETTRNLISAGTQTLLEHPDQKRALEEDPSLIPNAVEEMLRWVTPVQTFCRYATGDSELRGKRISEGDYLVLMYGSANRDEEVFGANADRFDIRRKNASRHVAFGFGEHLCMGASLARMEARVLFEELLSLAPDFGVVGPIVRLPSILMNGLVDMPVVFER